MDRYQLREYGYVDSGAQRQLKVKTTRKKYISNREAFLNKFIVPIEASGDMNIFPDYSKIPVVKKNPKYIKYKFKELA